MRSLIRKHFGFFLGLAVLVPPALILFSGAAQAQKIYQPPKFNPPKIPSYQPPKFNPPKIPSYQPPPFNPPTNPPFQPPGIPNNPGGFNPQTPIFPPTNQNKIPKFETVWTCSKCNGVLAKGTATPPGQCQHCGAKIINGIGGGGGFNNNPNPGFGGNPNPGNPGFPNNPNPPMPVNPGGQGIPPNPNPGGPGQAPVNPGDNNFVVPVNFENPPPPNGGAPNNPPNNGPSGASSRPVVAQSGFSPMPFIIAGVVLVFLIMMGVVVTIVVIKLSND